MIEHERLAVNSQYSVPLSDIPIEFSSSKKWNRISSNSSGVRVSSWTRRGSRVQFVQDNSTQERLKRRGIVGQRLPIPSNVAAKGIQICNLPMFQWIDRDSTISILLRCFVDDSKMLSTIRGQVQVVPTQTYWRTIVFHQGQNETPRSQQRRLSIVDGWMHTHDWLQRTHVALVVSKIMLGLERQPRLYGVEMHAWELSHHETPSS